MPDEHERVERDTECPPAGPAAQAVEDRGAPPDRHERDEPRCHAHGGQAAERVAQPDPPVPEPAERGQSAREGRVHLERVAPVEPALAEPQRAARVHHGVDQEEPGDHGRPVPVRCHQFEPHEHEQTGGGRPVPERRGHGRAPLHRPPEHGRGGAVQQPQRVEHPPHRPEQQRRRDEPHPQQDVERSRGRVRVRILRAREPVGHDERSPARASAPATPCAGQGRRARRARGAR